MGFFSAEEICYTILHGQSAHRRPGIPRADPGPGRRRRRARDPAVRRIFHRQHPQPQHPPSLRPGGRPASSAGASSAASPSSAASSRCTSPPTSSTSAKPTRRPRSSSTSPRCACCSTGSWSARWSAATPPRWCAGPATSSSAAARRFFPRKKRAALREHPRRQPGRAARSRADRGPDLQLRADQRGAVDAGRGLLPPRQALVAAAPREGRQAPRDAGAPYPRGVPRRVRPGGRACRGQEGAAVPGGARRKTAGSRRARCCAGGRSR